MIFAWIKRQWAQISTKVGALLTALSPVLVNYASIDPRFGYAGAACGILLVVWNQDGGRANG